MEKLEKANKLQREIGELESVLSIISYNGQLYQGDQGKKHEIEFIKFFGRRWTGSDTVSENCRLEEKEMIKEVCDMLKVRLMEKINVRKAELVGMFS